MFDFIVVGGGSAGCIVAAELSADPRLRVLLIEAGPSAEDHPETLRADGYKDAFVNDAIFYERFSEPQPHCGGQRVFLGSGKLLGGSGSVNGMVYTRGAREDYAEWPEGWRWNDVCADFEALEARLRLHRRDPTRWTEACISAAEACGFERREDLNDGHLGNVIGYEWMSYEGDRRRSSYVAFLREMRERPNLEVRTGAVVHRVVVREGRAVAVEYDVAGALERAEARREIVLCAGALETPKILLLSGIGPANEIRAHGVEVVCDSPGVGRNLHDHPNVPVFFRAAKSVDCRYPQLYSFYRTNLGSSLPGGQSDTCYVFWPAPSAMKEAVQRMLPAQILSERLYQSPAKLWLRRGIGAAFSLGVVKGFVDRLYGIIVILGKPRSRGSVRLASADPKRPARIDPRYFEEREDLQTMVQGVRIARQLGASAGLAAWKSRELMPGSWARSDRALERFVQHNAITTYHFAGTCRMGDDVHAVVDTRLELNGVRALRIADASVVPTTPVSAMNAPSMLVGYRAARLALARASEKRASSA
jgi:choline dehydrogenase-like flavoprotein